MTNADMPATPIRFSLEQNKPLEQCGTSGLTKREIFAMAAMQGMFASNTHARLAGTDICDLSIKYADHLLSKLAV